MPRVSFAELPADARVWVFPSDRALEGDEGARLLESVDAFLDEWKAHGTPLRCARDWREERFLVLGVDPTAEQASGCSIDGMFRVLRELEGRLGTGLVRGGRVFYRRPDGSVAMAPRSEVARLATAGEIGPDTPVFDTTLTRLDDYRERFERPARDSWVASLLPAGVDADGARDPVSAASHPAAPPRTRHP